MTYPKETRPPNQLSPLSLIYPCIPLPCRPWFDPPFSHDSVYLPCKWQGSNKKMPFYRRDSTHPSAINCGWQKLLTFRPLHLAIERSLIIDIHEWWVSPVWVGCTPKHSQISAYLLGEFSCVYNVMNFLWTGQSANDPRLIHIVFLVWNFLRCSEYSLLLVKFPYESLSLVVPQSYLVWSPACLLDDTMKFPLPITRPPFNGWPKTAHLILDNL